LGAKVGCTVSFDHEPEIKGINFVIERISVYETRIKFQKYYHTDYHLKGINLDMDRSLQLRLRLIPDQDINNKIGCKVLLLHHYDEMEWNEEFHDNVLNNEHGIFDVNYDDEGNELAEARRYWRVEDVLDPYKARVAILSDKNGDGTIEDKELECHDFTYWDYWRDTTDVNGQPFREYLTVEMKNKTRYFIFLRGEEIVAYQVTVV
jgi:hypothetical protein